MFAQLDEFDTLTPLMMTPSPRSTMLLKDDQLLQTNFDNHVSLLQIQTSSCNTNDSGRSPKFRRPTTSKTLLAPMGSLWKSYNYDIVDHHQQAKFNKNCHHQHCPLGLYYYILYYT